MTNRSRKLFRKGRKSESDEKEGHVRPVDIDTTVQASSGVWVDVPKGMVIAPGTEVDDAGVLRLESGELAVWHHRCKFHGPCERYTTGEENFVKLEEVLYIVTGKGKGAPWCPNCITKMAEDEKRKQLHEQFRGSKGNN